MLLALLGCIVCSPTNIRQAASVTGVDAVADVVAVRPEAVVVPVAVEADVVVPLAQRVVPRSSLYVAINQSAHLQADC